VGHAAQVGEKRIIYRLLVGKPEKTRALGRLRHWWMDNIKMGPVKLGWGVVDWIGLAISLQHASVASYG
jgi:hypothetical protein